MLGRVPFLRSMEIVLLLINGKKNWLDGSLSVGLNWKIGGMFVDLCGC